jgi:hypothetical protein
MTPEGRIVAIGGYVNTAAFGSFTLNSQGAEDVFLADLRVP